MKIETAIERSKTKMKMTNEQAIEQLNEIIACWEEFLRSPENNDLQGTGLELDALRMGLRALEEKPRWIPCAERLPEMHEEVECTGRYEESDLVLICDASELHPQVHVGRCRRIGGKTWWKTREWKVLDKVTAWMPLPETYSGED